MPDKYFTLRENALENPVQILWVLQFSISEPSLKLSSLFPFSLSGNNIKW